MELDHVLIALADLTASVEDFEKRYGLGSVAGGRHVGWGTANRIVPLGDTYLELLAVVDQREAATSAFGNWIAQALVGRPLGWAVRTDNLAGIAQRLMLAVSSGSRPTSDGEVLSWRNAGIAQAAVEPGLPFFIEWVSQTHFPGRASADHPAAPNRITKLILTGDPSRLSNWLGSHALPIEMGPGTPGVRAVVISTAAGEIVIGPDPS